MLGPFDTSHQEPFVRRHSSALSEGTGQMARGEPTLPREIFERQAPVQIGIQELLDTPFLPRCESSSPQSAAPDHRAGIAPGDVHGRGTAHVIDEQRTCFVRPKK